jgi:hypothetical protein
MSTLRTELVRSVVPDGFWFDFTEELFIAYEKAPDFCDVMDLATGQAIDMTPRLRNALLDSKLLELGKKHGAQAWEEPNAAGNCSHTRLLFGDKVTFTVSSVTNLSGVVRPALFRDQLVLENGLFSI